MKKILSFFLFFAFGNFLAGQNSYLVNYYPDAGNPGGLNNETDNTITGWTTILNGGIASNLWSAPVTIPFAFDYYGQAVTSFRVSPNGLLTFSTATTVPPNDNAALPSATLPDSTIAVFWDRFTAAPPTGSNDRVYYKIFGTAPNRQLWIKWFSMEYGSPTVSNSSVYAYFACVLEEGTNKIYFVDYNYHFPSTGFTTTVGVQDNSTTAVQVNASPSLDLNTGGSSLADNDYYEFSPYLIAPVNLATNKILAPTGKSCFDGFPQVEIINYGTTDATNFTISYRLNGGTVITENYTGTLLSGDTLIYTFSTPISGLTVGTHTLDAWVNIAGDAYSGNDSITNYSFDQKAIISVPHLADFETTTSTDTFYVETAVNSAVARSSGTGNNSTWSLRFAGAGSTTAWVTPTGNEWDINESYSAKAVFCVDASTLSGLKMKFDLRQEAASSSSLERSNFRVLVNGNQISPTFRPQNSFGDPYQTYEYNLSAYLGGIVTVTFESRNRSTSDEAFLDNVFFFVPPPNEVEMVEVVSPSGITCGTGTQQVIIKFLNNGTNSISTLTASYQVGTGTPVTETVTISPALAPGDTFTYTFTTPITTLAGGNNTITAWVKLTGDPFANNDTSAVNIYKLNPISPNDVITFETYSPPTNTQVLDTMYWEIGPEAGIDISAVAANNSNYGLLMEGKSFSGFTTPSNGNEWLINEDHSAKVTFCIDATAVTPGTPLEFKFDLKQTYTFNTAYSNFRVLINGVQVGNTYRPTTNSADPFVTHTIDVSAYAGQQFNITFETRNKYNNANSSPGDNAFIDNINLYMPLPNDMQVIDIISPVPYSCGDTSAPVIVVIKNNGINTQSNFNIEAQITGATPTTLSVTYTNSISYGQTDTVFLGNINTTAGGNVVIYAYTMLANDDNTNNDGITKTILIRPLPASLSVSDTTICGPQKVLFDLTGEPLTYQWFETATSTTPVFTGNLYLTGTINQDTTIYVSAFSKDYYHVGPADNTLGPGFSTSFFSSSRGLVFDVYANCSLDSVRVYPGSQGGTITLILEDANGTQLASTAVYVPAGISDTMIYVGFSLTPGQGYVLHSSGSNGSFFYNTSGSAYPYSLPGLISITGAANGSDDYYFYYDWVVSPEVCSTPKTPLNITVLPLPNADLGPDTIGCQGAVTLDAGNPGASYLWSTGATTQTISYNGIGDVWVEVSYASFCKDRDTVHVAVLSPPVVNFPDSMTVCGGVVLDATNPYGTYLWNTGTGTPTLSVTNSGTYWVQVTNACNMTASDTVTITVNPGPFFDLGPDTTICQGDVLTLSVIPNASYQYQWNTGATGTSIQVTAAGQYILTAVNPNNNCSYSDTINVATSPLPVVDLGPDTLACGTVELDAGNPGASYLWNTGATTQTLDASTSGKYIVTVTNANGCSASDTINVIISPTFSIDIGPDTVVCNVPYTLTANYSNGTYQWSTGDTTQSIAVITSGTYWVKVFDANGCMQKDTAVVQIAPQIQEPFASDVINSCSSPVILDAQNYPLDYLWNTGDTTQTLSVTASGTYWVQISSACGDVLSDTVQVNLSSAPVIPLPADTTACDSVLLDAGNPGASFLWNTGAVSQTILVKDIGVYSVTVTNANNCSATQQVFVNVYPTPSVDFYLPDTYYVNQYLSVTPDVTPYAQSVFWDFGPSAVPNPTASGLGQQIFAYPDTGLYSVTLIASNGHCKDSLTRTIVIIQVPNNLQSLDNLAEIKLFPNPTQGMLTLYLKLKEGDADISWTLYDLQGKKILEKSPRKSAELRETLDLSRNPDGVYLLYLRIGEETFRYKIVKY